MSAHLRMRVYCTPVFKIHKLSKYFSNKSKISLHASISAAASEHGRPLNLHCRQSHFSGEATLPVPVGQRHDAGHNKHGISP